MTPRREDVFSSVPPSNSLVYVSDPWRTFLSWLGALQGPSSCLVRCFRNGREAKTQVCHARCGGPRTPSKSADANLVFSFVENVIFKTDPWLWKVKHNRIELVTRPDQPPKNYINDNAFFNSSVKLGRDVSGCASWRCVGHRRTNRRWVIHTYQNNTLTQWSWCYTQLP